MANRLEGYLGCPKCRTVLFKLEAEAVDAAGVFQHVRAAMSGVDAGDGRSCPACGANVVRLPGKQAVWPS